MPYWGSFSPYVSVAKKRAKAEKKLKALRKKNANLKPVFIEGTTITKTWWGKSWNINLESYADYSNRIGRGRSYVRNNAVLDLQIKSGIIESLVQGTRNTPYKVKIKIKALKKDTWKNIKKACQGEFDSLQELFEGKFPKSLSEIFTNKKSGLFPSPQEISFDCSCPDWADMCKHVAATLYGIGARLDLKPELFFELRDVKMKDLVTGVLKKKADDLLQKAKKKASRIINDTNISEIFGIDIESESTPRKKLKKKNPLKTSGKTVKKTQTKKKVKISNQKRQRTVKSRSRAATGVV
ncbi:MAG: hypothetical protein L6416_03595 [Candidatus Omnitrophica bacterium]|nr:hypothetical protein [Candidatus Omnitrophota bacterium]